jgi:serine/threonine protein kinase
MSPEQARGETVDARSDLWAIGVVLYESLTGSRPFEGSTQAVIFEAILSKPPIPPSARNPRIPPEWERIITRLLEKDRALRYQSAPDLLADLKRLSRDSSSGRTISAPPPRRRWRIAILAAVAAALLACAATYFLLHRSTDIQSLAVLPFVNASQNADADCLSEGITGSLIDTLAGLNGLKVRSNNAVRKYEGRQIDARQAGRELDVHPRRPGKSLRRAQLVPDLPQHRARVRFPPLRAALSGARPQNEIPCVIPCQESHHDAADVHRALPHRRQVRSAG